MEKTPSKAELAKMNNERRAREALQQRLDGLLQKEKDAIMRLVPTIMDIVSNQPEISYNQLVRMLTHTKSKGGETSFPNGLPRETVRNAVALLKLVGTLKAGQLPTAERISNPILSLSSESWEQMLTIGKGYDPEQKTR